jgi:MoxR-like ATPase
MTLDPTGLAETTPGPSDAPAGPTDAQLAAQPAVAPTDDRALAEALARARDAITAQLRKRIVGQDDVIEHMLVALFARGHCLFVGVPGLAKTLLIQTLAESLALGFSRIQFTPDLMPSDITGTEVIEEDPGTGRRRFRFVEGPVFANILLADEINRTPPKTQAALLQSMQEQRVTVAGHTYDLPKPYLVFATQNPIEQEGTYPLPEAQLDRFMFMIRMGYPSADEEFRIARDTTTAAREAVTQVLGPAQILAFQQFALRVPVADHLVRMAVELVRRTRPGEAEAPAEVREFVSWGAGPRASQSLILAAKARALLHGRFAVAEDDLRSLALPVLRHRVMTNFHAEAAGKDADWVITGLLAGL